MPATERNYGIDLDEMVRKYGPDRVERGLKRMIENMRAEESATHPNAQQFHTVLNPSVFPRQTTGVSYEPFDCIARNRQGVPGVGSPPLCQALLPASNVGNDAGGF